MTTTTTPSPLDPSRLEALLESAQLLHSSLDLQDLLRHLLRTVMGRLLVGRGLVAVDGADGMRLALVRGMPKLRAGDVFEEATAREAGARSFFPIGNEEHPVGLLGISRPPSGEIAAEEMESLRALLGIAASGIGNARAHAEAQRLNTDLDQKVQELRALLDLVRGLSSTLEPEAVASLLMLTLAGRWAIRRYALAVSKEGHAPVIRRKGIVLPDLQGSQEILSQMPEAVRVEELPEGEFKSALEAQQAALLFPLRSSESTSGIVVLGQRPGAQSYTADDLEFGAGLVAQAGVAFENSWYVRETLERKQMEQELALAASIQDGLFPKGMPKLSGYDVAARNRPARQCGGDLYDALCFEEQAEKRRACLFCVADVSGKGLPASLLMSSMQANLRALSNRVTSLTELAASINGLLYATSPSNKFVTAIILEIDPATGAGRYVNAGHNECVLLRHDAGETELLKSTGLPLGMLPGMTYEEGSFQLGAGDLLALYSDGVPEAYDEAENEWGEERLLETLKSSRDESAANIVTRIFEEIDLFAGVAPQHDDITVLIVKRDF
jgi:sigma-B regulation protein RsbU (phosphoserine phosphatase)